jgi:hypothetical protein
LLFGIQQLKIVYRETIDFVSNVIYSRPTVYEKVCNVYSYIFYRVGNGYVLDQKMAEVELMLESILDCPLLPLCRFFLQIALLSAY